MAVSSKVATSNKNYKNIATQEYDPAYNQKVQGLKNQLAQNQMTLEQQKGGINTNFNSQVASQNLANKKTMNNISNTALGRGLQNSSIVTSGLGEANVINNRVVNEINTSRTGALNDIDQQKALLAQNNQATLTGMSADRLNEIANLARSLEDRDWDKSYKQVGLDLELEQMLKEQEYKNKSLAQEKLIHGENLAWQKDSFGQNLSWEKQRLAQQLASSASSGGGSGGSGGYGEAEGIDNSAYNEYLAGYYSIVNDDGLTEAQKKSRLGNMSKEMQLYGSKNGADLSELITLSSKYGAPAPKLPNLGTQKLENKIVKKETKKETAKPKNNNTLIGKIAGWFK